MARLQMQTQIEAQRWIDVAATKGHDQPLQLAYPQRLLTTRLSGHLSPPLASLAWSETVSEQNGCRIDGVFAKAGNQLDRRLFAQVSPDQPGALAGEISNGSGHVAI
jgi:hypothetical protein